MVLISLKLKSKRKTLFAIVGLVSLLIIVNVGCMSSDLYRPQIDFTNVDPMNIKRVVVSARNHQSMVIDNNGSLWAWGWNNWGELGDGTTEERHSPVYIMTDVVAVSAHAAYSVALRTDGSLWAWGGNYWGELGDGGVRERHTPIHIKDDVAAVSVGVSNIVLIRTDGSLWDWRLEPLLHMLEDGATLNQQNPIHIMGDVVAISTGALHTIAVQIDGSLWTWGRNFRGELGDGTTIDRYSPLRIKDNIMLPN